MKKAAKQDLVILMMFLVPLGLWPPGVTDGCVAISAGGREGQIEMTRQVINFRQPFPSLPMKKPSKQELVILMVFLVI